MTEHLLIRDESDADIDAIEAVTIEAFKTLGVSSQTEQYIIAGGLSSPSSSPVMCPAVKSSSTRRS